MLPQFFLKPTLAHLIGWQLCIWNKYYMWNTFCKLKFFIILQPSRLTNCEKCFIASHLDAWKASALSFSFLTDECNMISHECFHIITVSFCANTDVKLQRWPGLMKTIWESPRYCSLIYRSNSQNNIYCTVEFYHHRSYMFITGESCAINNYFT